MENFKYVFYYTTRNILWQYAYGFLYIGLLALALGLPLCGAFFISILTCGKFSATDGTKELILLTLCNAFLCLFVLGALVLCYFAQKKALQKVFFKPYKRFKLIPQIERISSKMVFLYILLNLPTFLVSLFVDMVIKPHFNLGARFDMEATKYLISAIVCGAPISYLYLLIINRFFVRKYATIVEKREEDNTGLPVATSHDEV